jgi:hypothetical protein
VLRDLSKKLLPCNTKVATEKYTEVVAFSMHKLGSKNQRELLPCNTKVATPKIY